ncbi:purine nucleoside phosphorylase [Cutibacterium acnes JCM 18916]|nr:purine nucleoside phosphorylase [Cutibacterium acnes JCM 18916]
MTSPEFTDPQAIARNAADAIRSRLSLTSVDMGLVLGSGWSAGVDRLGTTLGGSR